MMETIQVEIRNKNAMTILRGLEKAKIIRLIKTNSNEKTSPLLHKGVFTRDRALQIIQQIDNSRNEWDQRTF